MIVNRNDGRNKRYRVSSDVRDKNSEPVGVLILERRPDIVSILREGIWKIYNNEFYPQKSDFDFEEFEDAADKFEKMTDDRPPEPEWFEE